MQSPRTVRLELVELTPTTLLTLIERPVDFQEQFGFAAADGLGDFFVSGEVSTSWLDQLRSPTGANPWVYGFAVVHRALRQAIGSAGFKGPPDEDGVVEIAYGIVPAHQGRGYATEAAAALLAFAAADPRVRLNRAHTLAEENASTHVLRKCGFVYVGEVMDPDDGLVWRWERSYQ